MDGSADLFMSGAWNPSSNGYWADPFADMSSLYMPDTMTLALRWCEFVVINNGTYFRALDRVLSYFLTDIELTDIEDSKEKRDISDFLHSTEGLDILDDLHVAGLNYLVYGNDFSSMIMPFKRYLSCGKCGLELQLKHVFDDTRFRFKWTDCAFNAYCPKCEYTGVWKHIDRRVGRTGKVTMKHWSPHEIELLWDPYTDDVSHIWKIPDEFRKLVKQGKLFHLERIPSELIKCVKENKHLRFEKDNIYHMKETTLSGIRNRGWGISRVLSNFRQAWYVQVLHRYNEAIALDYVIPFRLITPAPGPGSGDQAKDALLNLNMGGYMSQIQRMIRQRRKDPAMWHTLPFPVQYQALGGDATQLAPRELLDQGLEVLLNNVGVPVELYKGSLQIQSAPPALRLFEATWSHLLHNMNGYLANVLKRLCQLMGWERASARLQPVTHADDLQKQMAKLQLMMGGQASKQTGLASVGINYHDEIKRQMDEQKFEAEQQNKLTEELEQQAQMDQMATPQPPMDPSMMGAGGGMPMDPSMAGGGGAPPAGGGAGAPMPPGSAGAMAAMPTINSKPTTPQEMQAKAQTLAQQILSMPEAQKDSTLIQLNKSDPMMHSLVSSEIERTKQQAKTQGGAMLINQQFGKQGSNRSVLD